MAEKGLAWPQREKSKNMTINECSPKVRELANSSELVDSLESFLDGLEKLEQEMSESDRTYDDYLGDEDRYTGELLPKISDALRERRYSINQLRVEPFYKKTTDTYAMDYCHCSDITVIEQFRKMVGHVRQIPDLIIHRSKNMLHQNCFIEVKLEGNEEVWDDFKKLTNFRNACRYIQKHVNQEEVNPVFHFHILLFIGRDLKEKIRNSSSKTKELLKKRNRDIVCIYKDNVKFCCTTLGEILDKTVNDYNTKDKLPNLGASVENLIVLLDSIKNRKVGNGPSLQEVREAVNNESKALEEPLLDHRERESLIEKIWYSTFDSKEYPHIKAYGINVLCNLPNGEDKSIQKATIALKVLLKLDNNV